MSTNHPITITNTGRRIPRTFLAVLLAAFLCALLGCSGDNRSEVSGTVRLNGKDIEEGSINFIPVEGNTGPGAGSVIQNGKYHVTRDKGVTPGKNRVEIRAFRNTGRMMQHPMGSPGVLIEERVPAFPPSFNDESTLVRDVQRDRDVIDFDINLPEADKPAGN